MNKLFLISVALLVLAAAGCEIQANTARNPETAQQEAAPTENEPPQALPSQPVQTTENATNSTEQNDFSSAQSPHWAHMPVTYSLNEKQCGSYEATRIKRALVNIIKATNNLVSFKKVNGTADIDISCTLLENCYKTSVEIYNEYVVRYETICQHELGLTKTIIYGNTITKADITLYGLAGFAETKGQGPSGFYVGTCGHSITETHELLHAFGYSHSQDNRSIMYPDADFFGLITQKSGACKGSEKHIDGDIAEDLIKTYSS